MTRSIIYCGILILSQLVVSGGRMTKKKKNSKAKKLTVKDLKKLVGGTLPRPLCTAKGVPGPGGVLHESHNE